MKNVRFLSLILVFAVLTGMGLGCKTGPSEEEQALAQFQEQFTLVDQAYQELQSIRTELAAGEAAKAEIEAIPEKKRTDEQKAELAELETKLPELIAKSEEAYDALQEKLVDFLNTGLNEFPDSEETAKALKIYSDEAIFVAEDMVAKSGDYKKAIDHLAGAIGYYTAVGLPVYAPLEDKVAEFEDWRFVTKERFDGVKKGMTMDEVKEIVGVPYFRNIQDDVKKGVQTWLYKKKEGGAAAVYFKIKSGKVYSTNWEAVKVKVVTE